MLIYLLQTYRLQIRMNPLQQEHIFINHGMQCNGFIGNSNLSEMDCDHNNWKGPGYVHRSSALFSFERLTHTAGTADSSDHQQSREKIM